MSIKEDVKAVLSKLILLALTFIILVIIFGLIGVI